MMRSGIFYDDETLTEMMKPFLTDDRVRGVMYYGKMEDFIDAGRLEKMRRDTDRPGRICIFGVGAGLVRKADTLVYCDLARWEIQLRYRAGMPNFRQTNYKEDSLRKIKRGYFVEWRIADKRKMEIFEQIDWFLDTNRKGNPKLASGEAVRCGLKQIASQPFRLVPYFDPGVWGGQWMKEVCGLPAEEKNYAWSFDGVPEENSLYLRISDVRIEIPAMDLVLYQPKELLGMKNYCRFGAEFPIRFDFLDTMDGQNLSLQVHPLTEYIRSHYGMTYTQDESYYILDTGENAGVYLGLKENVNPGEMAKDLYEAQKGAYPFPAEKYVNRFPAKKHDHFLIPAGTVHCSAADTMVLEISATPYNFTFKLWDWDRLGLDGLPRPIHIEDGLRNIQWDRTTGWVRNNLVNQTELIHEGTDYTEEKTGLHEFEFIETRRFTSGGKTCHDSSEGFHICNLVDGSAAVIESPDGRFEPYAVHYAETFIIPASVGKYTVRPAAAGEEIKIIKAYVRNR
ncbi:MAG: class I mannose-6-phosphate isomerase [Erysipelotrichaceae bacterium]|nr:class I mannose-6-phosphate isomerase [Erysipelotrichaceae bacterium]